MVEMLLNNIEAMILDVTIDQDYRLQQDYSKALFSSNYQANLLYETHYFEYFHCSFCHATPEDLWRIGKTNTG